MNDNQYIVYIDCNFELFNEHKIVYSIILGTKLVFIF